MTDTPAPAQQTLVVECARDHAYLHHLRELLLGIVCQTAAVGASSLSLEIAVARGRGLRLFTLPEDERRVQQWTTQVDRVIECIRQADFCADPGALSLFNLPRSIHAIRAGASAIHLAHPARHSADHPAHPVRSSVCYIAPSTSPSTNEGLLRSVLDARSTSAPHGMLDMVLLPGDASVGRRDSTLPTSVLRLQAEYNFSICSLGSTMELAAWTNTRLAQRQAVSLLLRFGDTALPALATPSVLHQEQPADLRACACHAVPLESGRGVGPALSSGVVGMQRGRGASRCPLSQLELDERDIQLIAHVGHFVWRGSLAQAAAEAGADFAPALQDGSGAGGTAHMELVVESRVRQADLELGIVFGYPWYVSPPEASGAVQELGGFAHQADHDKQTRTLRGLGASLQRAQEALLCRCAVRRHFEDAPRLPPNVASLLQSRFVLWPSSERPDVLLLKCVASAAQMVRPPPPAEHEAEDSAEAAELLATTPLLGSFNPFFHCRGGGSAKVLALCAAGVGSGAQRQQPQPGQPPQPPPSHHPQPPPTHHPQPPPRHGAPMSSLAQPPPPRGTSSHLSPPHPAAPRGSAGGGGQQEPAGQLPRTFGGQPPRGPMQFQPASAVMPQPHAMSPATTAAVRQPARPPNAGVPSSLIKKKKMQRIGQLQVGEAE